MIQLEMRHHTVESAQIHEEEAAEEVTEQEERVFEEVLYVPLSACGSCFWISLSRGDSICQRNYLIQIGRCVSGALVDVECPR